MLKAKLVMIVCCGLIQLESHAQTLHTLKYGFTGALNASQLTTPSIKASSGLKWQYAAGITLEQLFSKRLAVAAELKYARHGSNAKVSGIGGNDAIVTEYNYITLPVFVRLQPNKEPVFLELGGQAGYFLAGRSYFASSKNQASRLQNINRIDVGLTGGVGYRFGPHLVVDARYYHSLRTLYEEFTIADPTTGLPTLIKLIPQYQRVWSLNLSYYFN